MRLPARVDEPDVVHLPLDFMNPLVLAPGNTAIAKGEEAHRDAAQALVA